MAFETIVPRWQARLADNVDYELALKSVCEQAEMWLLHEQSGLFSRFVRLWDLGHEQHNQQVIDDGIKSLNLAVKLFQDKVANHVPNDPRLYTVLVVKIKKQWYYLDEQSFMVPFNMNMPQMVRNCFKYAEYSSWLVRPILLPITLKEDQLRPVPYLRAFTHNRDKWLKLNPLIDN